MPLLEFVEIVRMLTVKVVAWMGLGIASGIAVLCLGLLPSIYPGFERIDRHQQDVMQLEAEIKSIHGYQNMHQALDDSKSILQLKAQECGLPAHAPKDVYSGTIIELAEEYQRLTSQVYNIPSCSDL